MELEKVLEKIEKVCDRLNISFADRQALMESIKSLYKNSPK